MKNILDYISQHYGYILVAAGIVIAVAKFILVRIEHKKSPNNTVFIISIVLVWVGITKEVVTTVRDTNNDKAMDEMRDFLHKRPRDTFILYKDNPSSKPHQMDSSVVASSIQKEKATPVDRKFPTSIQCIASLTISTTKNYYWKVFIDDSLVWTFVQYDKLSDPSFYNRESEYRFSRKYYSFPILCGTHTWYADFKKDGDKGGVSSKRKINISTNQAASIDLDDIY